MAIDIIRGNQQAIIQLCESHGVKSLFVFGSASTDKFNPNHSDVDLIVDIDESDPIRKGEFMMDLWFKLEELFKKNVDLLTYNSIKNPVLKKSIDKTKRVIYERPD